MSIIYRHIKDAPLTVEELDGNFLDLDQRMSLLESAFPKAEAISHCVQEDARVTLMSHSGTALGSFEIPPFRLKARGEWKKEESYFYGDLVVQPGQTFFCIKNHRAGEIFKADLEAPYWQLMIDVLSVFNKK